MLKSYLFKFLAIFAVCMTVSFGLSAQWDATLTVDSGDAAGDYDARQSAFGPGLTDPVTATAELVIDTSGATTACFMTDMDLTGKIALIDRGACAFVGKVQVAQDAGAMAAIVCNNNVASPAQAFALGGDDMGAITIPSVMISYEACQVIRMGDPAAMITLAAGNDYVYGPEESCDMALAITPGTYTVDTIVGGSTAFAGSGNARWYSYTPTANTTATVSNCGNAVDSRLWVITDCDLAVALVAGENDDCDGDNGVFSSETSWIAQEGVTYYISWHDRWSDDGFDFTLSEADLPMVNFTVTVDMSNETVAPEGVFLAGSHNEWTDGEMTDNGDGTWTGVITATTLDTVQYKFKNGPDGWEDGDLSACGLEDGFGGSNRAFLANTTQDQVLATVCFNSCEACPPDVSCPLWVDENFDNYELGGINSQSPIWVLWDGSTASFDSDVTDAQANSGTQSLIVDSAEPDDMVLLLGNRTEGNYILKWKFYVPAGSSAYYNIQKDEAPGTEFGMQASFAADGTGSLDAEGAGIATFDYPQDEWFEVLNFVDLDNDRIQLIINGQMVYSWAFSSSTFGVQDGSIQLGGINFFGNTGNLYYVDDVVLKQVDACGPDAIICDGLDAYETGLISDQSPWWTQWSPGAVGEDAEVTTEQFASCEQSLKITAADPDDMILLLGNRTEGNYALSWNMYVPAGSGAYYNLQKDEVPAVEFGREVVFNADGTGDYGGDAFTYPHDEWFVVAHTYDVDNDAASVTIAGVEVAQHSISEGGMNQLGSIDFFGLASSSSLYYVDDVFFGRLPSLAGNVCSGANDISGLFGQGMGNVQTSDIYNNTGYSSTGDPEDGWDCFGEPDGGGAMPSLENTIWFSFVGDGETYFIETGMCDGVTDYIEDGDTQIAVYSGDDCGALTPVACNEDGPNAEVGNYIAAVELPTEAGVTYYMMVDGFSFNGANSDGEFCFTVDQLTAPAPVTMTVTVDMSVIGASADGVFLSGSFNEWTAPGNSVPLTDNGDGTWTVTVDVPANATTEYKFQNGVADDAWENIDLSEGDGCTLGDFGNRFVMTTDQNVTQDEVCFNYCVTCIEVSVADAEFAAAISVFPNPTSDNTNIQFNFEDASDLTIRLTNTLGQTVKSALVKNALQGTHTMNVSDLAAGIYMLQITDGERVATRSLVVD